MNVSGKNGQFDALRGGSIDRVANAVDRAVAVRQIGRNLHRRRFDPLHYYTVQVSIIVAPAFLCRRIQSSTSSGLIGIMPGMNAFSVCP